MTTALGYTEVRYETRLVWQEGTPKGGEEWLQPDLLLRRLDGNYDIGDLKLPLHNRRRLVRGARRRRRFIDDVHAGVAQLNYYQRWFSYPENARHAQEKLGITVNQPRCLLIVGSSENVRRDEIDEASRIVREFDLVDYDSLVNMYLFGSGPLT